MWDPDRGGERNAVVASWVYCRPCQLLEDARESNPPTDRNGWHLVLEPAAAAAARTRRRMDADLEQRQQRQ